MTLQRRLAEHALTRHPAQLAPVLERIGAPETIALLTRSRAARGSAVIECLSPRLAADVLAGLTPEIAAQTLGPRSVDVIARILRRIDADAREAILDQLEPDTARSVRAVVELPESSAGALMDPNVLALPQQLTAREALARVRREAEAARYNLYVLDEAKLVGALNLRELLIARPGQRLSDLMVREPHRILATASHAALVQHPGWRTVHSLPVVDGSGAYLGAIRYRTLRALEQEARGGASRDADTASAFGDLLAAAAAGIVDAFGGQTSNGRKP